MPSYSFETGMFDNRHNYFSCTELLYPQYELYILLLKPTRPIKKTYKMNLILKVNFLGLILLTLLMSNVVGAGTPEYTKTLSTTKRYWVESDYQANQPPDGNVTTVYTTIYHRKFIEVKEEAKVITLDIKYVQLWEDSRIGTAFSPVDKKNGRLTIPWWEIEKRLIWIPDVHVRDLLKVKGPSEDGMQNIVTNLAILTSNPFHENVTLVRATMEAKFTIFCPFSYRNYPMDTQNCKFRIGAKLSRNFQLRLYDPGQKYHNYYKIVDHLGFDISKEFVAARSRKKNGRIYIGFDVTMNRIPRPFIYQYYLPSMAIVLVSQLSFIVPLSAIPGRIALVVTQFLALTNIYIQQMVGHIHNLHNYNYIYLGLVGIYDGVINLFSCIII